MRSIVLASALLAALAISATAYATPLTTTYFHFDGHDNGDEVKQSFSFSLNSSQISGEEFGVVQYSIDVSKGFYVLLEFTNPTWCQSNCTNGAPFDFYLQTSGIDYAGYLGPQLYTGDESDPTFIFGTYDLGPDYFAGGPDASLTISATPEPSSLLLLGTGALGCVGALRRRFVKA